MGNKFSHESHHRKDQNFVSKNPEVVKSFHELTAGGNVLTLDKFRVKFGEFLSPYLWRHLQGDAQAVEMNMEQFVGHACSLSDMSTDIYVQILGSADALLKASFEAADIHTTEYDKAFLRSLKSDMTKNGDTADALIKWMNIVCPRLCHAIQAKVLDAFFHRKRDIEFPKSDILTPVELFILINSLPTTVYFPQGTSEGNLCKGTLWTKLYSSHHQGISINRFDAKVFQYKGSSVAIFHKTDHQLFIVASDEEWRHSVNKYGGPNTFLWQFRPNFDLYDLPEKPIFCNFKLRSGTFGLNVGRHFTVDGEMATIAEMEVWGCAGTGALEDQLKVKHRAKLQAERHGKVPLPGNWDENPDKNLMEMAGYEFSTEQRDDRPPEER